MMGGKHKMEETSTGISDAQLPGVLELYRRQKWTIVSMEKKSDGWTVVAKKE
jgi:hypothetical protein